MLLHSIIRTLCTYCSITTYRFLVFNSCLSEDQQRYATSSNAVPWTSSQATLHRAGHGRDNRVDCKPAPPAKIRRNKIRSPHQPVLRWQPPARHSAHFVRASQLLPARWRLSTRRCARTPRSPGRPRAGSPRPCRASARPARGTRSCGRRPAGPVRGNRVQKAARWVRAQERRPPLLPAGTIDGPDGKVQSFYHFTD